MDQKKWKCPGCGKVYSVKVDAFPKLCPPCRTGRKVAPPREAARQSSHIPSRDEPTAEKSSDARFLLTVIGAALLSGSLLFFVMFYDWSATRKTDRAHPQVADASQTIAKPETVEVTVDETVSEAPDRNVQLQADAAKANDERIQTARKDVATLLSKAYLTAAAIDHWRDANFAEFQTNEWDLSLESIPPESLAISDDGQFFPLVSQNFHRAAETLKLKFDTEAERDENRRNVSDILKETVSRIDAIAAGYGIEFEEAHGSSRYREAVANFIIESRRVIAALKELKASRPTEETVRQCGELDWILYTSYASIPSPPRKSKGDGSVEMTENILGFITTATFHHGFLHIKQNGSLRNELSEEDTLASFFKCIRLGKEAVDVLEELQVLTANQ